MTNPYRPPVSPAAPAAQRGRSGLDVIATLDFWFSWQGRISRLPYFAGLGLVIAVSNINRMFPDDSTTLQVAFLPVWLFALWVNLALMAKRAHDRNHSAWILLLLLVPLVNLIFGLYLLFAPGKRGTNDYGRDPLESPGGRLPQESIKDMWRCPSCRRGNSNRVLSCRHCGYDKLASPAEG